MSELLTPGYDKRVYVDRMLRNHDDCEAHVLARSKHSFLFDFVEPGMPVRRNLMLSTGYFDARYSH